ncbi:hypothetical protein TSOC_007764, partial [Tetrabaena socialis]
ARHRAGLLRGFPLPPAPQRPPQPGQCRRVRRLSAERAGAADATAAAGPPVGPAGPGLPPAALPLLHGCERPDRIRRLPRASRPPVAFAGGRAATYGGNPPAGLGAASADHGHCGALRAPVLDGLHAAAARGQPRYCAGCWPACRSCWHVCYGGLSHLHARPLRPPPVQHISAADGAAWWRSQDKARI